MSQPADQADFEVRLISLGGLMRGAGIYLRGGVFLVHASSVSTQGLGVPWPPFLKVVAGDDAALGAAIRSALEGSRNEVVDPGGRELLAPLLKLARARSWRALATGARYLGLADEGGRVLLHLHEPPDARGNFASKEDRSVDLRGATDAALGAVVRQALAPDEV